LKKGNFVFTKGGKQRKRLGTPFKTELPKHKIKDLPVLKHEQFPHQGGKHGYKKGSGVDDSHTYVEVLDDTERLKCAVDKKTKKQYEPKWPRQIEGIEYPRGTFYSTESQKFAGPPKKVAGKQLPEELYDEPPKVEFEARKISDLLATRQRYEEEIDDRQDLIEVTKEMKSALEQGYPVPGLEDPEIQERQIRDFDERIEDYERQQYDLQKVIGALDKKVPHYKSELINAYKESGAEEKIAREKTEETFKEISQQYEIEGG
jgi:hypothetical protein